jgi:hypothetical protein
MNATSALPGKPKQKAAALQLPYWLREFALIRLAVVTCTGTLGISAAAVFASNWYLDQASEQRLQAQQARDAAYTRYAHVENEKEEIRIFQPQFLALRDKGLIGEERRLDWVDAIRQIQEQRRLLPLNYEFEPQQAVKLDTRLALGDYTLRGSRMSLHMDLLHEVDLFNFFEDLRQHAYFAVQDCVLRRAAAAATPGAPSLTADCELNWLTLAPAEMVRAAAKKKRK